MAATSRVPPNARVNKWTVVQDAKEEANTLFDEPTTKSGPAQEAGKSLDDAREQTGEKIEKLGEDMQKP